ncbi:MAG: diguanylate cyclase [Chloroflexaceae bacterium]|nr:diguanylate cyclase [Chloroflexaceae bacterium]
MHYSVQEVHRVLAGNMSDPAALRLLLAQVSDILQLSQIALDQSVDGVYWLNEAGEHVYVNDAACLMAGFEAGELLGVNVMDLDPTLSLEMWQQRWERYKRNGSTTYENIHHRKDGSRFHVETTTTYMEINGKAYLCSVVRNITERKQNEATLRNLNLQLTRSVAELEQRSQQMSLLHRMNSLLQRARSLDEASTLSLPFLSRMFPDHAGAIYILRDDTTTLERMAAWGTPKPPDRLPTNQCTGMGGASTDNGDRITNCCAMRGTYGLAAGLCIRLFSGNETLGMLVLGNSPSAVGAAREHWKYLAVNVADMLSLTFANLRLQERLKQQAIRDSLTGLYNRRYLDEMLSQEINQAVQQVQPIAAILVDLDHFKRFNDTYRHDGGDAVLREFARLLQTSTRRKSVVCRLGGEEFVLIMPNVNQDEAVHHAEELRRATEQLEVEFEAWSIGGITASFGVAIFPQHGTSINSLIAAADQALYRAKAEGRNRVYAAQREATTS